MDIILNEKSLDGQFTYDNFCNYMRQEVIPSLRLLEENDCFVYKEYDTYKRKITSECSFADFLKIQGDPVINEFKIYLHKLSSSAPYWNDSVSSISLSIPDMDVLAGALPSAMENKVRAWGLRNIQHIVELWNKTHSDNIVSI